MLKIAHCDDRLEDREEIINTLTQIEEKWNENFEIFSFSTGTELCSYLQENYCDVILLDILMDEIDGIETATRIRDMGTDSLIIFISSYDKRIKELFDFRTIAFLDKPINKFKLEEALLKAKTILSQDNKNIFTYNKNGSTRYLAVKNIISFESRRNEIIIHTTKENVNYYGTLSEIWKFIQNMNTFIMPHKSFIFNLNFISIKSDKITIKQTGETYNIGRKYKNDTQERYTKFLENKWR